MKLLALPSLAAAALSCPALSQVLLHDLTQPGAQTIGACGDVDGDGLPDLLLGDAIDGSAATGAGAVRVLSGVTAAALHELFGDAPFQNLGRAIDGAGDVNADGFPDVIAGGPTGSVARVWSGATGAVLHDLTGFGPLDRFGSGVAGLGDVDFDGFDDFAVSATQDVLGALGAGYVVIYKGSTGQVHGSAFGDCQSSEFGAAIAGLGDVDGDGTPELAVYQATSACGSLVRVLRPNGSVLTELGADGALSLGADAVAAAGDLDGDGLPDLLVGSPGAGSCGGPSEGLARAYSVATGSLLLHVPGGPCASFGWATAGVGDWNGDGGNDVAISAIHDGYVDVLSGVGGAFLARVQPLTEHNFGYQLVGLGDLNGDGFVEIGGTGSSAGAWVHSSCPGSIEAYGSGCKGTNGFIPALAVSGCPNPGAKIKVEVQGGFGGQPALLAIGPAAAQIPIGTAGGVGLSVCNLLLAPIQVLAPIGALSGFGPGAGELALAMTIPAGTAGLALHLQAACLDPFTPNGFSVTNGVRIEIE